MFRTTQRIKRTCDDLISIRGSLSVQNCGARLYLRPLHKSQTYQLQDLSSSNKINYKIVIIRQFEIYITLSGSRIALIESTNQRATLQECSVH